MTRKQVTNMRLSNKKQQNILVTGTISLIEIVDDDIRSNNMGGAFEVGVSADCRILNNLTSDRHGWLLKVCRIEVVRSKRLI
jgi:hypothetical protein